jgi:glycosyltransferase involved in cell wall biosynthesis
MSIQSPDFIGLSSQRKLRLCYISNLNSSHTRRWIDWFARHGHETCLLADVPVKEAWQGTQVIDLSKFFYAPIIRFPIWSVWLRRFLKQWCPDILHAHRVNSAGWLAAFSGFHPYIVTPWGSDVFIQAHRSKIAHLLARYTLKHADLVTVNSQVMGQQAISLGARGDQVRNVQFGIEMDIFNPQELTEQQKNDFRKQLSIPEKAPLVLCPRAISPIYNIDIILQSIPQVRQKFPDVVFAFIVYNVDQDYKTHLDGMVRDLDLQANTRWLSPIKQRRGLAELYHLSDAVVSVPTSDGTPVSVLEAMACARPMVCTDLPALREFIQQGESGWLVPVGEPVAIAEYIIRYLESPDMAREFGLKASQVVAETNNYDEDMQYMESLYYQFIRSEKR